MRHPGAAAGTLTELAEQKFARVRFGSRIAVLEAGPHSTELCGGTYQLHIQGAEELHLEFDSVMLEGCNSSFQVHLQVADEEFARPSAARSSRAARRA